MCEPNLSKDEVPIDLLLGISYKHQLCLKNTSSTNEFATWDIKRSYLDDSLRMKIESSTTMESFVIGDKNM